MEQTETKPRNTDEIDITQFFKWIGRGFRNLGDGLLRSMAGLRTIFFEYQRFFTFIIIGGLLLGIFYALAIKRDYYKSSMVLNCNYLNTQVLTNIVEKLNLLAEDDNRDVLMQELNIDSATAKNILEFEFRPFISEDDVVEREVLRSQLSSLTTDKKELVDQIVEKLEVENKDSYQITVLVRDPQIVKPLETSLINYLLNNQYIKRRMEINKVNLVLKKQKLMDDSKKLDSLKSVLLTNYQNLGKTSRGSNNVILADESMANPLNVFSEDFRINDEILDIDEQLYLRSDFEIVDPFTTFKHTESVGFFTIIVVSFFSSILLGYIIIGAWKFDRLLATYSTKE